MIAAGVRRVLGSLDDGNVESSWVLRVSYESKAVVRWFPNLLAAESRQLIAKRSDNGMDYRVRTVSSFRHITTAMTAETTA